MLGGQYFANVSLENNDPLDETRNISVAMNLTGVPDIAYDELYIEFDTLVVFGTSTII